MKSVIVSFRVPIGSTAFHMIQEMEARNENVSHFLRTLVEESVDSDFRYLKKRGDKWISIRNWLDQNTLDRFYEFYEKQERS